MRRIFTLYFLYICCIFHSQAQPGTLDKTFGTFGKVYTMYPQQQLNVAGSALQADDKIIIAGDYNTNGKSGFFVMRYLSKGALDTTFGDSGKATIQFKGYGGKARAVTVQPDEKIIVTGYGNNIDFDMLTFRLTKEGVLDSSFGIFGKIVTDLGSNDFSNAVCVQPDCKIVLGGSSNNAVCLVRYKANGKVDPSFGDKGKVISPFSFICGIRSLAIQDDNKIVAGGSDDYPKSVFLVARYNTNGAIDSSFGNNGFIRTQISSNGNLIERILLQKDQKIIAAGRTGLDNNQDTNKDMISVRYRANGKLDPSYGEAGISNISIKNASLEAYGAALQQDDRLIIAGYKTIIGNNPDYCLARLTKSGKRDTTFGNNGITITSIKQADIAYSVNIQKAGVIIAAGNSTTSDVQTRAVSLAAYQASNNISSNKTRYSGGFVAAISIYPNPAINNLQIHGSSTGETKISVIDLAGNIKLLASTDKEMYNLDISMLKAGNYLLKAETGGKTTTKMFIKQ